MDLPGHDLAWHGGVLTYGGIPVEELAAATGTPSIVYREARIRENFRAFVDAWDFSPLGTAVFYSAKTAPLPKILSLLAQWGARVEAACLHEVDLALDAGFGPEGILLDGPAHHQSTLSEALARGIRVFKVDSLDQARTLARAAEGAEVDVVVRLKARPSRWVQSPAEAMGSRFGLERRDLGALWALMRAHRGLTVAGLAVHVGSQVVGCGPYVRAARDLAGAAWEAWDLGFAPRWVDVGGGFPSPTLVSPSPAGMARTLVGRRPIPPLASYASSLRRALVGKVPPSVTHVVLEPGRVLVSNAAILLTRVMAVNGRWVFVDASRNFVPESLLFARRRFLASRHASSLTRVNLAGCTLSGGDVLGMGLRLPRCSQGDLLVMTDAGAYTVSKASRFTTPLPAVYMLAVDGTLTSLQPPLP